MSENNFIFQLKNKLKYTKDGVPDNYSSSLEFRPPNMAYYDEVTNLSQLVMTAIRDVTNDNKNEGETETEDKEESGRLPTAQEIKAILLSSNKVKFTEISKCFKDLIFKTCTLDGTVKMTRLLLDRISIADYTRLVCEYIAFFITPSLLSEEGV